MFQRCVGVLAAAGLAMTIACAQTDVGITTNVKTKLAADDTVKAYQINVDTRNGVVTLSGEVETAAAKEQALRIARETGGVRDVVDQLQVGGTAATGGFDDNLEGLAERGVAEVKEEGREATAKAGEVARGAAGAITDAAVTSAVKAKFLADSTVRAMRIDVDTNNGTVTLNGNVSSRAEADRAVSLARSTEGVKVVQDNLSVSR